MRAFGGAGRGLAGPSGAGWALRQRVDALAADLAGAEGVRQELARVQAQTAELLGTVSALKGQLKAARGSAPAGAGVVLPPRPAWQGGARRSKRPRCKQRPTTAR